MINKKTGYKVKANDFEFSFSQEEIDTVDMIKKATGEYNILKHHRSVNVKILSADIVTKKLTIEVEGEIFEVEIKEELDIVLEKMGFGFSSQKQIKEIRAPMPGLVLEIVVSEGQDMKEGETILILQAMKMENSIVIQNSATIKRIMVAAGQPVEKGQLLIELM